VISTPLKNISQNGNLPQIGMKIKTYSWKTGESVTFCVRLFFFGTLSGVIRIDVLCSKECMLQSTPRFPKSCLKGTPPKTNSKFAPENRPKIDPKGKDHLPTINFQVRKC